MTKIFNQETVLSFINLKTGFISSHLRGHEMRLQALDSIAGPRPTVAQSRPPLVGEGLLQVLYLCVRPPPHVTSQSDQSLHTEYPPSSANEIKLIEENSRTRAVNRRVGVLLFVCSNICVFFAMSLLIDIPGHNRALHSLVSSEGPKEEQSTPPWVSLGKEHLRVLSCVPPPQVAEHEDQ